MTGYFSIQRNPILCFRPLYPETEDLCSIWFTMCYFVRSFVIPTYFFHRVQSEIQGLTLGPDIEVKKGDVGYLYIGSLSCASVMAFLTVRSI
jgi:hypothetical protein